MAATPEETLTADAAAAPDPEQTLAVEARRRPKAAIAAIAAAVLALVGSLAVLGSSGDAPVAGLVEALRQNLGADPAPGQGIVAQRVLFFDDNLGQVIASTVLPALSTALIGVTLLFLYLATRARNPHVNRIPLVASIAGAVLVAFPAVVGTVVLALEINAFAGASEQSEQAAREALRSSTVAAAFSLVQLGQLVVGLAFVLTALYAMRVGLLTRFMGVLGVLVGLLFVLPLEGQPPIVKIFWLLALGALFLGRWPGGMPPAWATGEARPWPTQQELREQRDATRAERGARGLEAERPRRARRERAEPPETPAPERPAAKPHSSSKKKKHKRR